MTDDRPYNYNGERAKTSEELTPHEMFLADQSGAGAEQMLQILVSEMVAVVLSRDGKHPGRHLVSEPWLTQVNALSPQHLGMLVQYATWHLAEAILEHMDHTGDMERAYGFRYRDWSSHD